MSGIKFCDRHKGAFPAGATGSAKITGIIVREYDSGEQYEQHVNWDFCPECTVFLSAPKEGKFDPVKTAALERSLGMPESGIGMQESQQP